MCKYLLERKEVKLYKPTPAPRFQPMDPLIFTAIVLQKDLESKQENHLAIRQEKKKAQENPLEGALNVSYSQNPYKEL